MSQTNYKTRIGKINDLAQQVKAVCVNAQFEGGDFISNTVERNQRMLAATEELKNNIFESVQDEQQRLGVVTAWGSSIRDYMNTYGEMPRDEVLASAAQAMANTNQNMLESVSSESNMFESVNSTLATSEGALIRARNAGLIMPTTLMAATSDMATFVPANAEEIEIFEMTRVAVSNFGDFSAGDKLDNFAIGQYGNMLQAFACPDDKKPNGTKTQFVFDTSADTKVKSPIKGGSTVIYLDSQPIARCNGKGTLTPLNATAGVSGVVDLINGVVTVNFTGAPAANANLVFEFEIHVERSPELIPRINLEVSSEKMRPHDSIIGNDFTIQAFYTAQREHAVDLGSQLMASSRNVLAHQKDLLNVMKANFASHHAEVVNFPLTIEGNHTQREQYEQVLEVLNRVSTDMLTQTTTSGVRGVYCGSDAVNVLKVLAGTMFEFAPNYVEKPYIHYVGKLGRYKIFHVPAGFTYAGTTFDSWDMLCYGRGENHSEAGLVNGDAVSPVLINQGVVGTTKSAVTWTRRYQDIHPNSGFKYFRKIKMIPKA